MTEAIILFIIFQFKHLIADYFLQTEYMYRGKGKIQGWVEPLAWHSAVHAVFTLLIVSAFALWIGKSGQILYLLAFLDFASHFVIDRWKATGTKDISSDEFWHNLGIDQMLHHLVAIGIIFILLAWAHP